MDALLMNHFTGLAVSLVGFAVVALILLGGK